VKLRFSAVIMLVILTAQCTNVEAQVEEPAKPDRGGDDRFELEWAETDTDPEQTESGPQQGRPLLRIDIPDLTAPVQEQPTAPDVVETPTAEPGAEELAGQIEAMRRQLVELRREVRRLRAAVDKLSARLDSSSPLRKLAPPADGPRAGTDENEVNPFWLPQR